MSIYYSDEHVTLHHGDCLDVLAGLPDGSVDCIVTSPPYFGLRDYGVECQHGSESSPAEYVETLRAVFAEACRVLADDGTLWLNLGDSFAKGGGSGAPSAKSGLWGNGHRGGGPKMHAPATLTQRRNDGLPAKNLLMIPARVAIALQDDGWILRNDIIWAKPNGMPESVADRLSSKHEHVFMFSKARRYWFDLDAIREESVTTREGALSWARDSKEADVPGQSMRQHRAGRAGATPPGSTPQTNFGPTGERNGKFHPAGRNPGDVWTIPTQPFAGAHFAVMAPELARRAIAAGCKPGGVVLDPYSGSGTTGQQALRLGRRYVGIELNADYLDLSLSTRFRETPLDFGEAS